MNRLGYRLGYWSALDLACAAARRRHAAAKGLSFTGLADGDKGR